MAKYPARTCFVAGAIGPTNRTCSISTDVNSASTRGVTFDELVDAYYEQARGLVDGGADILLVETIFDTLNSKAAFFAIAKLFEDRQISLPLMASVTFIQPGSNRGVTGQTVEAFLEFDLPRAAAQRRHELRARAQRNAPADRGAGADRADLHQHVIPMPACPIRCCRPVSRKLRSPWRRSCASGPTTAGSISSAAAAARRRRIFAAIADAVKGIAAAARCRRSSLICA